MIVKEYGGYTLVCDTCGCSMDFDTFSEAVAYKRAYGWRSSHKSEYFNDEWVDECPDCRRSTAQEDFA